MKVGWKQFHGQHAQPLGRRVRLRHRGKIFDGTMIDVDPAAALIVQLDEGGIRAFNAADTTMTDYQVS